MFFKKLFGKKKPQELTQKGMITVGPSLRIRTSQDAKRNGIQGIQWSATLEDSCPLCQRLDGKVMSVNNPYFDLFVPPLHDGCKCVRVFILDEEEGVDFDWRTPSDKFLTEHAPHLLEKKQRIQRSLDKA